MCTERMTVVRVVMGPGPVGLLSTEEEICAGILCCHPGPSQSFQIPLEIPPGGEPFSRSLLLPAYP